MTYSKDNLRQIFQQPFNQEGWQNMLRHYFHATELKAERERIDDTPDDEKGYYLGAIDTTDNYRIGLFYYQIQHGNVARKRVGLRNLVKSFINPNWGEFDAALVVFDSGSVWRLSFVCDIKGENTAPKRYTYLFGEGDSFYNTPVGRFDALQRKGISFENFKDAFSVEALSKEFFDEYREHYADIVEYITGKRYVKEKGKWVEKTIHEPCHEIFDQFVAVYKDPEKTVRDYIKKLMGRLVFLQFLQKKEWMGVPADRQDWKGGDTRFLQNKFNEFADKDNFIDGFLEPLFNDLNTNRQDNNDLASPKVGSDIKIPFLNGGLFQLDEEDCSNIRLPQHLLGDVLDFFERYNFTIDENDPNDAQIGVDPEMLGRVFENLLEDNKDKGAFYTPKEIVQYMCQESLIAYLQTGIDDESHKESIRQFVLTHESERLRVGDGTSGMHLGSMAEDISIKLLNVKICDPAIGSGAFPMGLLRQLYLCQCAIHPELEEKNAADIKRHIIQNNIYGVDIEKGAVDIARLRFWLSLIVDEETPRFLPNLDFKIMQGNSLLEQYKGVDLSKMTTLSTEQGEGTQLTWFDKELDILRFDLREKLNDYYNCSDHLRKEQLKQEIIDNVKRQLREQSINVDFGDLDLSANDQFTLWHTWFYDVFSQGGFDIVIGNPPYVNISSMPEMHETFKKYYPEIHTGYNDLMYYFLCHGVRLLSIDGIMVFITSNYYLGNDYAKKLRIYLNDKVDKVVNFHNAKIFESANIHTAISFVKRKNDSQTVLFFTYKKNTLENVVLNEDYTLSTLERKGLSDTWLIADTSIVAIIEKMKAGNIFLGDISEIEQGSKSGKNKIFTVSNKFAAEHQFETNIVRKNIKNSDIHKYTYSDRGNVLLYIDNNTIIEKNPKVYEYLFQHYDDLASRNEVSQGLYPWYRFDRPRKKEIFDAVEKIIVPYRAEHNRFAYDNQQCFNDGGDIRAIVIKKDSNFSILFILGLLNSTLIDWYFGFIGKPKGKVREYFNRPLSEIPIPRATNEQQQPIIALVDTILKTKNNDLAADTNDLENEIDLLVYHLYGLTYDEVLIVDPETPITREEYERYHIENR